jgi:ABC-2 type transport system permease protein
MRPELIVAGKEFRDHLTSKRFLIIFTILLLLSVISMAQGMDQYNQMLDSYKQAAAQNPQQPWFQEQVAGLRQQIADAEARGAPAEEIRSLQYQLDKMINPDMPSMLFVFSTFNSKYFIMIAMVLSITVGFDLITREREEGSLRSLLSHPVYRDSVINGKFLAVVGVLVTAIGMVFLLMLAVMLFYGVVPSGDDLSRIVVYFLMALLYCGVFFALAMMASAIAKSSAMSIMIVLGIAMALLIIPQSSYDIANFIMGPPPEVKWIEPVPFPAEGNVSIPEPVGAEGVSSKMDQAILPKPIAPGWDTDIQRYYERQRLIVDTINTISPMYNFGDRISNSILYKSGGVMPLLDAYSTRTLIYKEPTIVDSLAAVWVNILALIIELIIPLVISYVAFLRADVR